MTFFVSTAMGFITSNKVDPKFPKRCIDQSRSRDVRWAYPFNTWNDANRFAMDLTSSPNWPPQSRYYAIMTSASPNIKEDIQEPEAPAKLGLGDRLKMLLSPSTT